MRRKPMILSDHVTLNKKKQWYYLIIPWNQVVQQKWLVVTQGFLSRFNFFPDHFSFFPVQIYFFLISFLFFLCRFHCISLLLAVKILLSITNFIDFGNTYFPDDVSDWRLCVLRNADPGLGLFFQALLWEQSYGKGES